MNERIKELYLQAVEYSNGQMTLGDTREYFAEKFAELIVSECANAIVNDSRLSDVRTARNGCVRTIKEHFGVEE
jgi:hypothetical protein